MIFYRYKYCLFFFCIIGLLYKPTILVDAQVIVPPSEQNQKEVRETNYISRYYTNNYKAIPRFVVFSTVWFSKPKDIASRVSLGGLGTAIKYFDDGTAYLEYTASTQQQTNEHTEEKNDTKKPGRLFLKVITGQTHNVYDLKLVPYKNTPTTSEQEESSLIIPLQKDRNTGISLLVDLIKTTPAGSPTRLIRYKNNKKEFTEHYQYTNSGALRTLTRKYESGAVDNFLYSFTTTGLQEVFHKNADNSAYQQKYTHNGTLQEREEYNAQGDITYRLAYTFDKNDFVIEKEEINENIKTIEKYSQNKIGTREVFSLSKENSNTKERLIESTVFEYNQKGNQIQGIGKTDLDVMNTQSSYADDGTLVQQRFFVNNILKKEIDFKEGNTKIETIFFNDLPVLRVYFKGIEKIKEEVLQDGEVVEVR